MYVCVYHQEVPRNPDDRTVTEKLPRPQATSLIDNGTDFLFFQARSGDDIRMKFPIAVVEEV